MLAFDGLITDFSQTPAAQGVFQGVMGLNLVEADLGAALHDSIEQPVDDKEREMRPISRKASASSCWRGYDANFLSNWLGGIMPAAIVATARSYPASSGRLGPP